MSSAAAVRSWTLVRTQTSENGTEVRLQVRGTVGTDRLIQFSVQLAVNIREPVRTGSNVAEPKEYEPRILEL
jgi:hypothetical protein